MDMLEQCVKFFKVNSKYTKTMLVNAGGGILKLHFLKTRIKYYIAV